MQWRGFAAKNRVPFVNLMSSTKASPPGRSQVPAVPASVALPLPSARPGFSELTRRETQIVELVAAGACNKQVAAQLAISEWTVGTHLRRIFVKLRVRSRAAMVYRYAMSRGQTEHRES